jgi:CrcB protein
MKNFIYIFLGGGLGSLFRFVIGNFISTRFPQFPYSILFVNLLGSFLIGLYFGSSLVSSLEEEFKIFLVIGFLGGLTTFSSFSLDNLKLLLEEKYFLLVLNVFSNVLGSLVLVYIGFRISKY